MRQQLVALHRIAAINQMALDDDIGPEVEFLYADLASVDLETAVVSPRVETIKTAPSRARRLTSVGDTLIPTLTGGTSWTSTRPLLIKTNEMSEVVFSTGFFSVSPSEGMDCRFLNYVLASKALLGELEAVSNGVTMKGFTPAQLARCRVWRPSLDVQTAIADFLDSETARIDALIEKKQRMIELLNNRFEASVHHAVTRGVRGIRPMRSASLSWLAEIPEGWGTPTVSTNFELQLGKMLNAEAASGLEQFAYLRNINVQWDRIDTTDLATMHFSEADRQRCDLRKGDVLICEGGEVGRAAVWADDLPNCYFQKAIHRARPRRGQNGRFLMYCLRAAAKMNVFAVQGNLSTIVHLTGEQLAVHRFPWPLAEEQTEIVEHLDSQALVVRSSCQRLASQIELLREHRQALITAAVTGQLEIPGVAA